MSTVKITELPEITSLNSNTSNTILVGVNLPTSVTGKITATTLANGLYKHNILNVGNNEDQYPNTIAQFAGTSNTYVQVNLENIMNEYGTADYVVGANTGSDTTLFIDLGFANKDFNNVYSYNSLRTSLYPLDGYLYVQGNTGYPGGNVVIGTTTENREIRFIAGGPNTENIVVRIGSSGLSLRNNANLTFSDGSTQTTAASPLAYSAAAYESANNNAVNLNTANNFLQANDAATLTSAKSYTDSANSALKSYSDTKFLANTTGRFDGSLTVSSDLTVNGSIVFANSGFSTTDAVVTISAANNGLHQPSGGDGYVLHLTGKHDVPTRIVGDSFGANGQNTFVIFGGRAARGNVEFPTAVQTGDVLCRLSGTSYGTTKYQTGGAARIDIVATENHTDSARGTAIKFYNILEGQNVLSHIATFNANSAVFTGVVNPSKGFQYTPNNITTIATAYTVDFQRDSMIRMSVNDNMTISLQNYVAGKIVEVWITNSAAQNKVITHGCLANNSTKQSTTFTILSNSCALLKYFSIDGDQQNTYVSITP